MGVTALEAAAQYGHTPCVEFLAQYEVEKTGALNTALMYAAQGNYPDCV